MTAANRSLPVALRPLAALVLAVACGAPVAASAATPTLRCDESMKSAFKPDAHTVVLQVQKVRKGAPYPNRTIEQGLYPDLRPTYGADLCWVKLLVGPGVPGPAGAPSTSRGIGIEVWLPEKAAWNHRFHAVGGAGWANGTEETMLDKISSVSGSGSDLFAAPRVAAEEGFVTSTTDNGQQVLGPSFALKPDGSLNYAGLRDWSYRSLYEQAVKTKALATAYYGSAPKYSYFSGGSGGGRQAMSVAQNLPEQYDGILARVPGVSFTSFIAEVYPSLLVERDLGGRHPTKEQLQLISRAAVSACDVIDGQHLGFVLDVKSCRYDPTKDPAVLCRTEGGTNDTPACVPRKLAQVMNKVWYGMTVDGSVPDPAVDNGWDAPLGGVRRWYGFPRGGAVLSLDADGWGGGPTVGRDVVGLALGPRFGSPPGPPPGFSGIRNASGDGADGWRTLSYSQLAGAYETLMALETDTGLNPQNPDLTRLRNAGTKLLHVTHMHDGSVWVQGHTDYYDKVIDRMGGLASVQSYYKFYILPGLAHGSVNGSGEPSANPPVEGRGQLYRALADWVEKGVSPDQMVFSSPPAGKVDPMRLHRDPPGPKVSLPACAYPTVPTHVGGDIRRAESYRCR